MPTGTVILKGASGLILVDTALITRARSYLKGPEALVEAGGILLGCYRGDHLDIRGMTSPMLEDRRTATSFDRRDPAHAEAAHAAWRASGQTVGFVGEWHTHTGHDATPSTIDLQTWRAILAKSKRTHLFLILAARCMSAHEGLNRQISRLNWPS